MFAEVGGCCAKLLSFKCDSGHIQKPIYLQVLLGKISFHSKKLHLVFMVYTAYSKKH